MHVHPAGGVVVNVTLTRAKRGARQQRVLLQPDLPFGISSRGIQGELVGAWNPVPNLQSRNIPVKGKRLRSVKIPTTKSAMLASTGDPSGNADTAVRSPSTNTADVSTSQTRSSVNHWLRRRSVRAAVSTAVHPLRALCTQARARNSPRPAGGAS